MIEVLDPSTEEVLDTVPEAGEAVIRASVERCCLNSGQACNAPTRLRVPRSLLADAEALAAEVAAGLRIGAALDPDSTPSAELVQREIFGPALAIRPFGDDEEAAALANATPYGLSGIGCELGRHGIEEFLEVKAVLGG
jgi:acyl-CoA reductase-like NAD-dependent aldehyde dehydrogenase